MSLIKSLYFKLLVLRADQYSICEVYRKHLGIKIGKNTRITGKNIEFGSEPYLIEIGDDCTITGGVIFETHDGGVGIFRKEYPGMNIFGRIKIGNSVFIGNRAIIMPGVTIGDHVVIGAGSIVTKDIPQNSVAAGVPARVIRTLDEYRQKALEKAVFIKSSDPDERMKEILSGLK